METKNNIKTLLMLYEQHPSLYVVKSADYHNRTKRENAYQQICQQYEEITKQPLSIEVAKKKINNLRSQYLDCVNKIKTSKSSGMSTNDIYKPTWWLFEDMKFLDPHIVQRKGESSITISSKQFSSSESSTIVEENDNEDLQFLDVANILGAEKCDKENTDPNLQSIPSCSKSTSGSHSLTFQHRKRKPKILSENLAKEAKEAKEAKDEFWTVAKNAIQTISKSDEMEDGLKYWILYLESELRKIKDEKRLKWLQKEIITLVYNENIE
ncbi:PREDICTED: uncharacterized protein LOC105565918 [Vollenhovia emeryi]|uniref:uncharacterized protein LOC105565918 n=1 Tax=Vollenhovia emeryi TaxID=411798 RepID=UPI0005F53224|nr:PREDICTED: uncharacterized protein LOC105565918 [Vollenhovia emeryi]